MKEKETNNWMNQALEWRQQHKEYVDILMTSTPYIYQPSPEDRHEPNLWKGAHWKWLLAQSE